GFKMKIKLSINDIAVKQLESAVWMYAYDYDEIAVHTIAGAAFELYTTRLKILNFDEDLKQILKDDKFKEFKSLWNRPYNIFKHGEYKHNPVDEFVYNEDTASWLIFIACEANLLG